MPVYGLAENSVGLAFPPLNHGPLIDRTARDSFMLQNRAIPVSGDEAPAVPVVSCGYPLNGHEVRIVNENYRQKIEPRPGADSSGMWQTVVNLRDRAREEIQHHCDEPDLNA